MIGLFGLAVDNEEFRLQNELKLDDWIVLGPFSIRKAGA